jgi:hypothetical protein
MSHFTGTPHKRTLQQNKALHKYCELLAKELNEHGITMQEFLSQAVDLDWNTRTVKEVIWKPIQKALLGKNSTTELDKVEDINEIWEHINRHIGTNWGLYVLFPANDPSDIAPLKLG